MQGFVPHCLNMVIVKINGQNYMDMVKLRSKFDTQFEYLSNKLNACKFRDCVNQFMKMEISHLKKCIKMKCMLDALLAWMETSGTCLCHTRKDTTRKT